MKFTVSLILFTIIAVIMMGIFNIPLWIVFVLVIAISLGRTAYVMHILYRSRDVKKIERFLTSSMKNPLYNYTLSLKNSSTNIQRQAIDNILATYKSPIMQATHRANRAMLDHQYPVAKQFAEQIPNDLLRNYHLALIEATQGQATAQHYVLAKPWMASLIAAVFHYKKGQLNEYELQKNNTLQQSRGIQYFTNYYFFEHINEKVKAPKEKKKKAHLVHN